MATKINLYKVMLFVIAMVLLTTTACTQAVTQATSESPTQIMATSTVEALSPTAIPSAVAPIPKPTEPVTIAFLYAGPAEDNGFSKVYDLAREAVQEKFGDRVKTVVIENVPTSEEATRTIEQLISDGAKMIVDAATLLDYGEAAAKAHPEIAFLRTDWVGNPNEATLYFETGRPNYLKGIAAGLMTKTNTIGYVGSFPSSYENAWVNAYAMGAQSVNPDIKVNVVFVGAWYDPSGAHQAAVSLMDSGADVLVTTINPDTVMSVAEERGGYSFGNYHSMTEFAPKGYITSDLLDMNGLLIQEVQNFLDGKWTGNMEYRIATVGDGISLDKWGPNVPQPVIDTVTEAYNRMATENWTPFTGPIYDAQGNLVVKEGEALTDYDFFMGVPWVVAGVNMPK